VTTVRAAVLRGARRLNIERIPLSALPAGGAWLDVEACGICGSDVHAVESGPRSGPAVLGHEIVGRVAEIDASSPYFADIAVGDRVVLEEALPCRACSYCRSGAHRLCPRSGRYGSTPVENAPSLWGGLADRVFMSPLATAHRVPAGLASELATLFVPISNGISWLTSAHLRPGEVVLVCGVGQHGLGTIAAARRAGAGLVIASGVRGDDDRLAVAAQLGADVLVRSDRESLADVISEHTAGRGADVIVDVTPDADQVVSTAIKVAAPRGRIVLAGLKRGALTAIDCDRIARLELALLGVAARDSWAIDEALRLLEQDGQLFAPMVSGTFGLEAVADAIAAVRSGDGAAAMVHPVVVPSLDR